MTIFKFFPTPSILLSIIILNVRTQGKKHENVTGGTTGLPRCLHTLHATASDSKFYLTSVRWEPLEASCRCYLTQLPAASDAILSEASCSCFRPRGNLKQVSEAPWSNLQLRQMQPEASCGCFGCNLKQFTAVSAALKKYLSTWCKFNIDHDTTVNDLSTLKWLHGAVAHETFADPTRICT